MALEEFDRTGRRKKVVLVMSLEGVPVQEHKKKKEKAEFKVEIKDLMTGRTIEGYVEASKVKRLNE